MRDRAGLKEVARAAGCSKAAVSSVLNNSKGTISVGATMRVKIQAAAERLGYKPHYHAQALSKGRTFVIGLVLDDTSRLLDQGYFWAQFAAGLESEVRRSGHDVLLIGPAEGETELERGIRYVQRGQVDALVIPWIKYRHHATALQNVQAPIVLVYAFEDLPFPIISDDAAPGVHAAVRHLVDLEHKRVLWVGLEQGSAVQWPERLNAFRTAARAANISATEWMLCNEQMAEPDTIEGFIEGSRRQFAAYLPKAEPFTAIVGYNELACLGIAQALREAGLQIPHDVSLLGFDNVYARLSIPPLTVISLRVPDVGAASAALALKMANEPAAVQALRTQRMNVPMELVVRKSTGPARALPLRTKDNWAGDF